MGSVQGSSATTVPNARRLLWAGFMAIFAAGVGFALRGGLYDNWSREFGFTGKQAGDIVGAGFTGFCFGIILGGIVCDTIGYGKLVIAAFVLHVASAIVTLSATTPANAASMLTWGVFIFFFANGVLEAVANPLVATLFPNDRTHYLNLLHAAWPAGLILGTLTGWYLDDELQVSWRVQVALYLIPAAIYGLMFLGQRMPRSEAKEKGSTLGDMFKDVGLLGAAVACGLLALFFVNNVGLSQTVSYSLAGALLAVVFVMTGFSIGSLLLFVLFIAHALVGTVELGTDGWIQNITGNLFTSAQGRGLFLWTSVIMCVLRFGGNFIERTLRLSPVGLLLACAVAACVGMHLASGMQSFGMALFALGIYAVGKTFFWPTMLAVVSDRFPRSGAVAISIMGGIGFLAAGMIGGPGLGYSKDRYTAEALQASNAAVYQQVKAPEPSKFLFLEPVHAIDGKLLAEAQDAKPGTPAQQAMVAAGHEGDRKTLAANAFIPAAMAVIYLLLLLWFKSIGGYKAVHIEETGRGAAEVGVSMDAAPPRDIARIVLTLALLGALIALSLWLIKPFLPALIWAAMIAVATWPVLLAVQRGLGGRRWLAVAVMSIALLLVFVVPLSLAIGTIVTHVDDITGWARSLDAHALDVPPDWLHKVPYAGPRLEAEWRSLAAEGVLSGKVSPYVGEAVSWFAGQMGSLGAVAGQFLLTVAIAALLYARGEAAARGLLLFARRLGDERGEASVRLAGAAIRGVALGVVVTALVDSLLGGLGLWIVGMPWVGVLTAVMFMLAVAQVGVVPVLGCAVIWQYAHGSTGWGTALLVWTVVVSVVDSLLRPVLIRRGADLPLLLIFAGVVGGLIAFGLVGIFIGPVVLAVTWTIVTTWVNEGAPRGSAPESDSAPPAAT